MGSFSAAVTAAERSATSSERESRAASRSMRADLSSGVGAWLWVVVRVRMRR